MPKGTPLFERCGGKSRQTGERCKRSPVPFTDPPRCICHGGNLPSVRAKARANFDRYLRGMVPWEPDWRRRRRIEAFLRSDARYEDRRMRKLGIARERLSGDIPPTMRVGSPIYD